METIFKQVAIVGAGAMGQGIAQMAAQAGAHVQVFDVASVQGAIDLSSVSVSGRGSPRNAQADAMAASGVDKYDIPAFLRRQSD